MMKHKLTALALLLALLFCGLIGCTKAAEKPQESGMKTMGELYAIEDGNTQLSLSDKLLVFVVQKDGKALRGIASLSGELFAELDAIDISEQGWEDKIKEKTASLPIARLDDLTAGIPSQAELDKEIGKTGQQLLDEGYLLDGFTVGDDGTVFFSVSKGDYSFTMTAAEKFENEEQREEYSDAFPAFTVKALVYADISFNCTDVELDS